MKIFELGITEVPADQQGLNPTPTTSVVTSQKPVRPGQAGIAGDAQQNKQAMDQNKQAMGAEEPNPVIAAKQKQEQKKTIQNQIKATQVQLKQLQAQLAAIR